MNINIERIKTMNINVENDDLHYVPTLFNPIRRERAIFGLSLNNTNLENLEIIDSHH